MRIPFEQHLFEDEAFFREVQDTEDELIDEYAMGVLPQTDESALAQRCERQPQLAQRLAMRKAFFAALCSLSQPAKSSLDSSSRTPASRLSQSRWFLIPGLAPTLAIAAGLLLVICIFLLRQERRVETHLSKLEQMQAGAPLHGMQRSPVATAALSGVSEMFFRSMLPAV